ncbi:MAG: 50S ribosomal protein L17 [Candidatus Omnitrophota bacterium]
MRHRRNTQNLSRFSSYYKATIRSLARNVLVNQRIVTTKLRAKLAMRLVNQLITLGKDINSLAARRRAFSILTDHGLVKRLFTDIAPRFSERKGGYTRIIPYRRRRGDNAELVVLELSVVYQIPRAVKAAPVKEEPKQKAPAEESKKKETPRPAPKPEHQEHKEKEARKPPKKILGGFEKFFKQKRDSSS